MKEIKLQTYSIYIDDIEKALKSTIDDLNPTSLFIITDENVSKLCLPKISFLNDVATIVVQPGEKYKNIETCQLIWQKMMEASLDRDSLVINIGGGVIGDMGGFCASTYKRGLRFIQIPTTILSSVDASVGGKLGVDFFGLKNNIGLFNNPEAVLIDTSFYDTLPKREVRSGFAEIIKHCLIKEQSQWSEIVKYDNLENLNWEDIISRNILVKKDIVEQDPFEKNIRKALNFGHTVGHSVETFALRHDISVLHGEAVAFGMIVECYLSYKLCGFPKDDLDKITTFILKLYGKIDLSSFKFEDLLKDMSQDKKNKNGVINCTLLKRIGSFEINQYPDVSLIKEGIMFYNNLG